MWIYSKRFIVGAALVAMAAGAQAYANLRQVPVPRLASVRAVTSSDFMVTGQVTARAERSFTILSRGSELRTVQVTDDTAIVRAGALIKLSDLVIGDKVDVTLMRGGDGKLRAVNVTVRMSTESV